MSATDTATWDATFRARFTPIVAVIVAALLLAVHVAIAALLTIKNTGVYFRFSDQVSFVVLGMVFAGLALLLTRPRLRIGPAGVAVRNTLGEKVIPWSQVRGISFPVGARWALVDLDDDEYVPVLAIQTHDKERAVAAMDEVRRLVAKYQG